MPSQQIRVPWLPDDAIPMASDTLPVVGQELVQGNNVYALFTRPAKKGPINCTRVSLRVAR